jgi:hypothetical protein
MGFTRSRVEAAVERLQSNNIEGIMEYLVMGTHGSNDASAQGEAEAERSVVSISEMSDLSLESSQQFSHRVPQQEVGAEDNEDNTIEEIEGEIISR